jgi:hypothetical protein
MEPGRSHWHPYSQPPTTRTIGRRASARRTTTSLPSKALSAFGANRFSYLCPVNFVVPEGSTYFSFFPQFGPVQVGRPHAIADILVVPCTAAEDSVDNPADAYQFSMYAPNGSLVKEQQKEFMYAFSDDAPIGTYTIHISSPSTSIYKTFEVEPYSGPKLTLVDSVSGQKLVNPRKFQAFRAEFSGFTPGDQLEVGLYQGETMDEFSSLPTGNWQLIDSWSAVANHNGQYNELLRLSAQTVPGPYFLAACAVDDCEPLYYMGGFVEPMVLQDRWVVPANGIVPPDIAWDFFILVD